MIYNLTPFKGLVKLHTCLNRVSFICIVFILTLYTLASGQERNRIDSLERIAPTLKGQIKFEVLKDLFSLYNQFDYNKSFSVSLEALNTAKETGDSLLIIRSYRMNGYALMNLVKNKQAIEVFQKALDIAESDKGNEKIKEQIKYILNSIALAYTDIGNYPKALDFHFRSLVLREEENNKLDVSISLNNIGLVYYRMSDYQKAIEFYDKCLSLKNEIKDKVDNERLLINMALCYISLNEYKKAISRINEALDFCGENCTDEIKREALNSIGIAFLQTNEIERARESFFKSLVISKAQNNIPFIALNLIYLNQVDQKDNNSLLAENYLKEAEGIIEGTGYTKVQLELYNAFSEYYKFKSDYQKSQNFSDKYILLYKEVISESMLRNLSQVQTNYAERENIKTIKEKDQVLVLKQELIDRQKAQYIFIVAIAMLVLGLAAVLLWANNKQRRISAELSMAKRQLEERVLERTVELKKSNTMLMQTNEELDNFLYKTSHDIRGPLSTLKGLNNLAIIHSEEPTVVKDILEKLNTQIDKMNKILSRISVVSKISKTELHAGVIDFKKMINEIVLFEERSGQLKNIKVIQEVEPNLNLISDPDFIRLILENLIDNSIKFFSSTLRVDPYVKIIVTKSGSDALILVEDNGIGIRYKSKEDIFHMFMRGSEKSEIGGVGLYLCKVSSDRIGGQIKLEDTSDSGTIFSVLLPLDITPLVELNHKLEEERKHDKLKLA